MVHYTIAYSVMIYVHRLLRPMLDKQSFAKFLGHLFKLD